MLKYFNIVLFCIFSQLAFSGETTVDDTTFRNNTISLETGLIHRGLIGITYDRLVLKKEWFDLSFDIHGGIGKYPGETLYNYYTGLGAVGHFGISNAFFLTGLSLEYFAMRGGAGFFIKPFNNQGVASVPYIGFQYKFDFGLDFKLRTGYFVGWAESADEAIELPSLGLSFGYSF